MADAAGNLGPASAARTFVLDTTAPATTAAITGVSDNAGILQGTVAPGGRTNDRTPTISGTLSAALAAGDTLRIFNGATLLGSAMVNNSAKTWSYTPTLPVTAGTTYSITARVADAAGNLGPASAARSFVLDTTAPATTAAITGVSDNAGILQGTVAPGGRTNDRTPTISGTLSAALAAGDTLRIFNGATLLGSAMVNNSAKTWSYTPTLPVTAGTTYSITARVADAAGNLGVASAARTFVLDTTAPATTAAITGVSDNAGILQGTVAPGGRTNDRTPTISGTLSAALAAGDTLRIFNGATLLGSAMVNNSAKTWSYTPTLPVPPARRTRSRRVWPMPPAISGWPRPPGRSFSIPPLRPPPPRSPVSAITPASCRARWPRVAAPMIGPPRSAAPCRPRWRPVTPCASSTAPRCWAARW